MSTTPMSTAVPTQPNPAEVGWQFVPQYYTFVNKHPNRLHCFYTKASTFTHGTEGEDITACHGQQEIHNKITEIGFQDCKVFIDCVDAQASANGGIVVQVIGEMSNRGEPWRKFVQTFFLAEQPGGYFVLNDIFRFLKEDTVDDDDASAVQEPVTTPSPPPNYSAPLAEPEPTPSPPAQPAPSMPVASPAPPEPVSEPVPEPASPPAAPTSMPEPEPHVNGHVEPPAEPEAESEPEKKSATPAPAVEEPTPEPAVEPSAPAYTSSPAPAASPAPGQQSEPVAMPTPSPAAPAAPKTWANLAAANSKKWGAAVATDSRGTSEAPPAPPSQPRTPQPPAPAPGAGVGRGAPGPRGDKEANPLYIAAQSVTTPQCFVKGVIEPVSQQMLTGMLAQRFGPVKEVEIVRSKACAFLEFNTLEAAKRAITTSLPVAAGGEGGLRIDLGDGAQARITVETRKERGERPPSRPHRGGAPPNGDTRGGFRGRGSIRGRGGPPK